MPPPPETPIKYIHLRKEGIILFENSLQHREFALKFVTEYDLDFSVLGAGFVRKLESGKLECYGESISLRKDPHPYDNEWINKFL